MAAVGCQSNQTHVFLLAFTNISGISSNSQAYVLDCFCCYMLKIYTASRDSLGQIFNIHLLWKPERRRYETRLTTGLNQCCTSYFFSLNEINTDNAHNMLIINPCWDPQLLPSWEELEWEGYILDGCSSDAKPHFGQKLVIAPKQVLPSVQPQEGVGWGYFSAWILTSSASECVVEGVNCTRTNHRNTLHSR